MNPALRPAFALVLATLLGACSTPGSRSSHHAAHGAVHDEANCPLTAPAAAPEVGASGAAATKIEAVPGAADYASAVKVTRLLKTQVDAAGQRLVYPTDGQAEVTAVRVEVAPGGRTGWHVHPLPCVGYMLEGELQVTLIDGRVHTFKAGDALMEMVNYEHEGLNPGTTSAKLVMIVIGTEGKAFTVKTQGPAAK